MEAVTVLGLLAGLVTTAGFAPQLVKGYRSRSMKDVSLFMPLVLITGMSLWLLYGVYLNDLPIILWNGVAISLNVIMVAMKLRFDGR